MNERLEALKIGGLLAVGYLVMMVIGMVGVLSRSN